MRISLFHRILPTRVHCERVLSSFDFAATLPMLRPGVTDARPHNVDSNLRSKVRIHSPLKRTKKCQKIPFLRKKFTQAYTAKQYCQSKMTEPQRHLDRISNNSFWLLIYAWKKTAWNVPRKEFFGSNRLRHFQDFDFISEKLFQSYRNTVGRTMGIKRTGKMAERSIDQAELVNTTTNLHMVFLGSLQKKKLLIKIRSLALGLFFQLLNFYFRIISNLLALKLL